MALKLKTPEVKDFQLLEADPTGETTVTFRQATTREHTLRADLWATASRIMRDGMGSEVELKQRISFPEIVRREVFLCIVGCNIEGPDGKLLFNFRQDPATGRPYLSMNEADFGLAWGSLPLDVALEIHSKVIELNPTWGSNAGEAEAS